MTVVSGHRAWVSEDQLPDSHQAVCSKAAETAELISGDGSHRPRRQQRPPSSERTSSLTTFWKSALTAGRQFRTKIPPPHCHPRSFQRTECRQGLSCQNRRSIPSPGEEPILECGGPTVKSPWQGGPRQPRAARDRSLNILLGTRFRSASRKCQS